MKPWHIIVAILGAVGIGGGVYWHVTRRVVRSLTDEQLKALQTSKDLGAWNIRIAETNVSGIYLVVWPDRYVATIDAATGKHVGPDSGFLDSATIDSLISTVGLSLPAPSGSRPS